MLLTLPASVSQGLTLGATLLQFDASGRGTVYQNPNPVGLGQASAALLHLAGTTSSALHLHVASGIVFLFHSSCVAAEQCMPLDRAIHKVIS